MSSSTLAHKLVAGSLLKNSFPQYFPHNLFHSLPFDIFLSLSRIHLFAHFLIMSNSVPGGSSSRLTDEHKLAQMFERVNPDIEEVDAPSRSEWLKVLFMRYFLQLMNHGLRENLLQLDAVDMDVANGLIRNRPYHSLRDVRTRNEFSLHVLGRMLKSCLELFVEGL